MYLNCISSSLEMIKSRHDLVTDFLTQEEWNNWLFPFSIYFVDSDDLEKMNLNDIKAKRIQFSTNKDFNYDLFERSQIDSDDNSPLPIYLLTSDSGEVGIRFIFTSNAPTIHVKIQLRTTDLTREKIIKLTSFITSFHTRSMQVDSISCFLSEEKYSSFIRDNLYACLHIKNVKFDFRIAPITYISHRLGEILGEERVRILQQSSIDVSNFEFGKSYNLSDFQTPVEKSDSKLIDIFQQLKLLSLS